MCITWDLLLDLIVLVVGCQGGAGGALGFIKYLY